MIIINFKTYSQTFGQKAIDLATIIKKVSQQSRVKIVVAASALDAFRLKQLGLDVWLQHLDEYDPGKHTGWLSAAQALELGIDTSLLNHSEHQISPGTARKIIKHRPAGFKIALGAKSLGQITTWVVKAKPDYIFYEPPELINNPDSSIATAKADTLQKAFVACGDIPLIAGAGIKNRQDVEICLKIGVKGIILSSAFVLASDPQKFLEEIVSAFDDIIQK